MSASDAIDLLLPAKVVRERSIHVRLVQPPACMPPTLDTRYSLTLLPADAICRR